MPGTRTAPALTGSASYRAVTVSLIDASGDERTVRLQPVPITVPLADIETMVAELAAITNASIYKVTVLDVFAGTKNASNALSASYQSVFDNIVLLAKDAATTQAVNAFVPAPEDSLILSGDVVDTTNVDYTAWRDAIIAILPTAFSAVSVRFTERREKNDSTPA